MTSKQKKIVLVVGEKLYEWLRNTAHERHVSINKLIRDYLLPEAKLEDEIKSSTNRND